MTLDSHARPYGSRRNGVSHTGSREFSREQRERVLAVLARHVGRGNAIATPDLVDEVGLPGRTVRSILATIDGEAVLIDKCPRGLYVREGLDDRGELGARLEHTAQSVLERFRRREAFEARLRDAS